MEIVHRRAGGWILRPIRLLRGACAVALRMQVPLAVMPLQVPPAFLPVKLTPSATLRGLAPTLRLRKVLPARMPAVRRPLQVPPEFLPVQLGTVRMLAEGARVFRLRKVVPAVMPAVHRAAVPCWGCSYLEQCSDRGSGVLRHLWGRRRVLGTPTQRTGRKEVCLLALIDSRTCRWISVKARTQSGSNCDPAIVCSSSNAPSGVFPFFSGW